VTPKLLPTEYIIIILNNNEHFNFISEYLNKMTIENLINNDILLQEDISIIVKIKEIKPTKTFKPDVDTEKQQKEIIVSDTKSDYTMSLFLYDEEISFIKLLKKDDYIAIYNPQISFKSNKKILNYCLNTIFIKIEMNEKKVIYNIYN